MKLTEALVKGKGKAYLKMSRITLQAKMDKSEINFAIVGSSKRPDSLALIIDSSNWQSGDFADSKSIFLDHLQAGVIFQHKADKHNLLYALVMNVSTDAFGKVQTQSRSLDRIMEYICPEDWEPISEEQ